MPGDVIYKWCWLIYLTIVHAEKWPEPGNDTLIFIPNPVESNMPGHWVPGSIVKAILGATPHTETTKIRIEMHMATKRPTAVRVTKKKSAKEISVLSKNTTSSEVTIVSNKTELKKVYSNVVTGFYEDNDGNPDLSENNNTDDPTENSTEAYSAVNSNNGEDTKDNSNGAQEGEDDKEKVKAETKEEKQNKDYDYSSYEETKTIVTKVKKRRKKDKAHNTPYRRRKTQ